MPPARPNGNYPRLANIIHDIDSGQYNTSLHSQQSTNVSSGSSSASPSDFEELSDSELYEMPPTTRRSTAATTRQTRKRNATQIEDGPEDDRDEVVVTAGPSRKRRNTDTGNRRGQNGVSRSQAEPIVIEDLDDEEDESGTTAAEKLKETLQKQREEQVKAQDNGDTEPPRLNKLQCVVCMDSFTDMTATSCGHLFCHECLISALRASEARRHQATGHHSKKSQCPVCRTTLNRTKKTDVIPLLVMQKGAATQPRRAKG